MWLFRRAPQQGVGRARNTSTSDYLSMEDGVGSRTQPLVAAGTPSSSSQHAPADHPRLTQSAPLPLARSRVSRINRLRGRLAKIIGPPQRGGTAPVADDTDLESMRQRWTAEKALLINDCTAARTEADQLQSTLQGWETLVRDLLFYGGLHGRAADLTARFAEQLRGSLGEVEGVQEVEVTELHLPSSSEYAPRIQLVKYCGPELSEWAVTWEPPSAQASGSITLRGRKFGVSFALVVAIGSLKLKGTMQCKWCPDEARPTIAAGFKRMPDLAFDISLAGKALSLGSETLRAWLQRQIERTLKEKVVLPKAVTVELPPLRHLLGQVGPDAERGSERGAGGRDDRAGG